MGVVTPAATECGQPSAISRLPQRERAIDCGTTAVALQSAHHQPATNNQRRALTFVPQDKGELDGGRDREVGRLRGIGVQASGAAVIRVSASELMGPLKFATTPRILPVSLRPGISLCLEGAAPAE